MTGKYVIYLLTIVETLLNIITNKKNVVRKRSISGKLAERMAHWLQGRFRRTGRR